MGWGLKRGFLKGQGLRVSMPVPRPLRIPYPGTNITKQISLYLGLNDKRPLGKQSYIMSKFVFKAAATEERY